MPSLSGTVKDSVGNFAARAVRVYLRTTGALVGQTISNATTGAWSITTPTTAEHFALVHDSSSIDDAEFAKVVSLLHFDGTNGATSTTDVIGKSWTFTGTAQLNTTQKKYGASALYINGSTGYISSPVSSDFTFGTGDFTVEYYFYPVAATTAGVVIDSRPQSVNGAYWVLGFDGAFNFGVNGGGPIVGSTATLNTWYHVALTRSGTSTRMFINGAQVGSTYTDNTNYASTQLRIGVNGFNLNNSVNGYIDDVRITKGVARYTANFTAPSVVFPDGLISGGAENAAIFDRLVPV